MGAEVRKTLSHDAYTIGWVCALPKERTAATAMLDERHEDLPQIQGDSNVYTLGRIGEHNVVIACLPKGRIGNSPATAIGVRMTATFPSIRFGMMVGIGGGVPKNDVRLGDVVIGTPTDQYPGVVQWDMGKAETGGFKRTGVLDAPPQILLSAVTKLEVDREMRGSAIPRYLGELKENWPRLVPKYTRAESLKDILFRSDYEHVLLTGSDGDKDEDECCRCDKSKTVNRRPRDNTEVKVHCGLVASGNQVIKKAADRDRINAELGGNVRCFEMEAAGLLMSDFPCIVIRGICDYADSHKNDPWQEHAAAVASAAAKELLSVVPAEQVTSLPLIKELHEIREKVTTISENVDDLTQEKNSREHQTVLDWLSPIDPVSQQNDHFKKKHPETGEWILASREFLDWVKNKKATLFCPGIPGAGKTITTSAVVRHLVRAFQHDPGVGIAYLYCRYDQEEEHVMDFLLTLLRQFSQRSLPKPVWELYQLYSNIKMRPTLNETRDVLVSVMCQYSKAFIIIDALDECQVSNEVLSFISEIFNLQDKTSVNIFATSRFVPNIEQKFYDRGSIVCVIRARDEDVREYLAGEMVKLEGVVSKCPGLNERIKDDITKAANGMFLLAHFYFDALTDKPTVSQVEEALKDYAEKSDDCRDGHQKSSSSRDIGFKAYERVYTLAMERIHRHKPGLRDLADRVLSWIVFCKRPLTPKELQHALAVEEGTAELDEDNLCEIDQMVSVCAGFVTVDQESDIIRLVHYTMQQYFEKTGEKWFPNAHADISKTCITYLSFDAFEAGPVLAKGRFEEQGQFSRRREAASYQEVHKRRQVNCLYRYATSNWGYHVEISFHEVKDVVIQFLNDEGKMRALADFHAFETDHFISGIEWPKEDTWTELHTDVYFGLYDMAKILLNAGHNPEIRNTRGKTPLLLAVESGHIEVVRAILKEGSPDVNSRDNTSRVSTEQENVTITRELTERGANPKFKSDSDDPEDSLVRAAANGALTVARDALENRAERNPAYPTNRETALAAATRNGDARMVRLLLENGAKGTPTDSDGQTPLSIAARNGYLDIARLLLERGADPNVRDSHEWTPLWFAVDQRDLEMANMLLGHGANPNLEDHEGWSPLVLAQWNRDEPMVRILSQKGAQVSNCSSITEAPKRHGQDLISRSWSRRYLAQDIPFPYGPPRLPLSCAAFNCREEIAQLLMNEGADPNTVDAILPPLSFATLAGHVGMSRLLLENGAHVNSRALGSWGGWTPLTFACFAGHESTAKLLLDNEADIDARANGDDHAGMTPLSFAAKTGHEGCVRLLLGRGAEPDAKGTGYWCSGRTPLSFAAESGHLGVVNLLLDNGAQPDSRDCRDRTPVSFAAGRAGHPKMPTGAVQIVKRLLDMGADPNSRDIEGRAPFSRAAAGGNVDVVKLLLGKGADPDLRDLTGRTPLSLASDTWRPGIQVIKLLLQNGADLDSRDAEGRTPLSYAAAQGNPNLIQLFLERGADPNSKDRTDRTPLSFAAGTDSQYDSLVPAIELLLQKGANPDSRDSTGRTPLSFAARNSRPNIKIIKLLLEHRADPNSRDSTGRTPLSFAARNSLPSIEVIKLLLEHGADPNSRDSTGRTPFSLLFWGWSLDCPKTIKLMLDKGADPEMKDCEGRTPLSLAAEGPPGDILLKRLNSLQNTILLLEQGVNPDCSDSKGRTPLSYTAGRSNTEDSGTKLAAILLEKGADLDSKDSKSRTPLSYAAEAISGEVATLLLEAGADPDSQDCEGRTPLSYATASHKETAEAMVELLLENGAYPNTKDSQGRTALLWAAEHKQKHQPAEVVRRLLAGGADPTLKDNDGRTPLSVAIEKNRSDVVELLREAEPQQPVVVVVEEDEEKEKKEKEKGSRAETWGRPFQTGIEGRMPLPLFGLLFMFVFFPVFISVAFLR